MAGIQTQEPVAPNAARQPSVVHDRSEVDIAHFKFIGLDRARRTCGELWPQRWELLRKSGESAIRDRLAPEDVLVRGDATFLIAFGKRSAAAAQKAAADIAESLNQHLDAASPPVVRVSVSTSTIAVADLAESIVQGHPGVSKPALSPSDRVKGVRWLFHPVWDARREQVSTYFTAPHVGGTGRRFRGYQFEELGGQRTDYLTLDAESIEISERALRGLRRQSKRAMVGFAIHITSLMRKRSREQVLARLSACDPQLSRRMVVKIAGVESSLPTLRLLHIVDALRERVPRVVLSVAWDEPDIGALLKSPATAIGFAYPDRLAETLSAQAKGALLSRFRAGADAAHARGVPIYVEGDIEPDLANEFCGAGADYIVSPAIWKPQLQPDGARRWPSSLLAAG